MNIGETQAFYMWLKLLSTATLILAQSTLDCWYLYQTCTKNTHVCNILSVWKLMNWYDTRYKGFVNLKYFTFLHTFQFLLQQSCPKLAVISLLKGAPSVWRCASFTNIHIHVIINGGHIFLHSQALLVILRQSVFPLKKLLWPVVPNLHDRRCDTFSIFQFITSHS